MNESESGPRLLPHHLEQLAKSAISGTVARERGYFSVEHKRELEELGFGRSQLIIPTLAISIHGVVADEAPWFVHRPDRPRIKDGHAKKYEIPTGRKMALDIHPRVRPNLANPRYPVFVTEGSKKCDALITAGAHAVIGVVGVWNWRGRNDDDGLAILPDWEWVSVKEGRLVFIVYDSDILLKQPVRLAMNRLGAALGRMGAEVAYTRLPSGEGGTKVGADDFIAGGHTLDDIVRLSTSEPPEPPSTSVGGSGGPEPRSTRQHPPRLAYEPDILGRLIEALRRVGHIGEERACRLVYLSATSRLLDEIVSLVAKGPSAAGKSATIDRVLSFFPDEAIVRLSGMSEHYLAYDTTPIKHKMLVLHEAAGMSGEYASYLVRTLLSEGCLRHGTVESTREGLKSMLVVREGPAGLITSTTQVNLHDENETRLLSVPIDDTRDQTARVMTAIASRNGRSVDLREWHELQFWLTDGRRSVDVPYATVLSTLIPPLAVRLRRDFASVLGLIRAHALLHRATRASSEAGGLVATLEDYDAVRKLVADLVSDGIGAQVSPAVRETVTAVAGLLDDESTHVSNARLAVVLKLDRAAVSRRARAAIDKGFLVNDEDRRGKPSRLRLGDPLPEDQVILPSVERLAECCSVDVDSGPPHPQGDGDDGRSDTKAPEPFVGNPDDAPGEHLDPEKEAAIERLVAEYFAAKEREKGS